MSCSMKSRHRIVNVDQAVTEIADPRLPSTWVSPHGALRFPFETRRLRNMPLVSNTLMKHSRDKQRHPVFFVILLRVGHKKFRY